MKRTRICQLLLLLLLLITGCRQIAAQVEELQKTSPAEQRKVIIPQASYTFTDRPTVELTFSLDDEDPLPAAVDVYAYWGTWTELRESE